MNLKRGDKDAIIVLLILIVLCFAVYPYIDDILGNKEDNQSLISTLLKEKRYAEKRKNGEYSGSSNYKNDGNQYYAVPGKESELFPFDPNTADSTALLRLGLRPWQVRNIYKYRAAGGRYRQPSDFARLYGLTAEEYERLAPYIKIAPQRMASDVYGTSSNGYNGSSDAYESMSSQIKHTTIKPDTVMFPRKIKAGEHININTADTSSLKRIPGIGSFYAYKIVYRRNQLGGFYSVNQLREIENFPVNSFPYMTVGQKNASSGVPEGVHRIRINHLNARELSRHPYIRYAQAKQIDEYRRQTGNIKKADDLCRLPSFNPDDVAKLAPYLDFE